MEQRPDVDRKLTGHDALSDYAESRVMDGPIRDTGRSFITELREEIADARNYACWWVRWQDYPEWENRMDEVLRLLGELWDEIDFVERGLEP